MQINLDRTLPRIGVFDVVFLRNVMIYFNPRDQAPGCAAPADRPAAGAACCSSGTESLHDISAELVPVRPSVYRRV